MWCARGLLMRFVLLLVLILFGVQGLIAETRVTTIAEVDAGSGGIEVDSAGNVYTSDFGPKLGNSPETGTRVWKILPDGSIELFAEGFLGASGSAIDSKGPATWATSRACTAGFTKTGKSRVPYT